MCGLSLAGQHRVEKLLSLSSGVCRGAQLGSCSLPCSARLQGRALSLEQGHGVRCTGELCWRAAALQNCSGALGAVVGELKGLISFTLCFLQVHYNRCSTVSCAWPSHQTVIWSQICVGDIRLHITKPEKVTAQNHLSLEILLSCLHQPVIPFSTNKRQKPLHIV